MKYVWMGIRLILPVAAIVLLTISLVQGGTQPFTSLGMLCSCLGLWLNIWCSRRTKGGKPE